MDDRKQIGLISAPECPEFYSGHSRSPAVHTRRHWDLSAVFRRKAMRIGCQDHPRSGSPTTFAPAPDGSMSAIIFLQMARPGPERSRTHRKGNGASIQLAALANMPDSNSSKRLFIGQKLCVRRKLPHLPVLLRCASIGYIFLRARRGRARRSSGARSPLQR